MRQWLMERRPEGRVREGDFRLVEAPIPEPDDRQVLLKTQYLGVAPVMMRYMTNETSFERPMQPGDVMLGRGVGIVAKSRHPKFKEGDAYQCKLGWREYGVIDGDDPYYMPFRMSQRDLPLSYGISSLAMSGFTAVIGLRDIGCAASGDRLLVSGAAGGVGSHIAFLARAMGCGPIVGLAGGARKCRLLTERLGYDAAIDYRAQDRDASIDREFPNGIDLYFDNVGGELLDAVMGRIRRRARIVICGRISEYLKDPSQYHRPRNLYRIGLMDSKMEGFFIYDYQDQFRDCEEQLAGLIRSGKLEPMEDIDDDIERMPAALISLYDGSNVGVRMVRVDRAADREFPRPTP